VVLLAAFLTCLAPPAACFGAKGRTPITGKYRARPGDRDIYLWPMSRGQEVVSSHPRTVSGALRALWDTMCLHTSRQEVGKRVTACVCTQTRAQL